jgi:hypothetical protein
MLYSQARPRRGQRLQESFSLVHWMCFYVHVQHPVRRLFSCFRRCASFFSPIQISPDNLSLVSWSGYSKCSTVGEVLE